MKVARPVRAGGRRKRTCNQVPRRRPTGTPLARAAAAGVLSGPDSEWEHTSAVTDDRGHGRLERRSIRTPTPLSRCFLGPGKCFGSVVMSVNSTARGPPRRSSMGSPACPPRLPDPSTSTTTNASIGPWKTGSTGPAMSLQRRHFPGQNRCRASSDLHHAELGDQHVPPRGTRQHRPRPPRPAQPRRRLRRVQHLTESDQIGRRPTTPGPWVPPRLIPKTRSALGSDAIYQFRHFSSGSLTLVFLVHT